MAENIGLWLVSFVGAIAFVFAIRTDVDRWFVIYTLLFAFCVALVVVFN